MACQLDLSEKMIKIDKPLASLYFFQLITEEGFLTFSCYSLEICIPMGISFLFSFAFHFSSQLFVGPPQPFCLFAFFFLGDGFDHCLLYSVTKLCP